MKSPNTKRLHKTRYGLYALIVLFLITGIFMFFPKEQTPSQDKELISDKKTVVESVPVIEKKITPVIPNQKTAFFSKEDGKPLLWYSIVNDSIRFYEEKGKDPVTGQDLVPVTSDILKKYKLIREVEKVKEKKDPKRFHKVNDLKIFKEKPKPKPKKEKRIGGIWNTSVVNTQKDDEVSLFIFNSENKIDVSLTRRFRSEFMERKYIVTDEIIYADEITKEIAENLQKSNVSYFEGNLKKYSDYICIAIADYSFKPNAYRNDLQDCTMQIKYFIYASDTAEILLSEEDKVIGSGQTKKTARLAAIEKFIL